MSETLAPTTELEAVNDMLSVIMESPIATLDETVGDAQLAYRLLRMESRAVQAEGWHWNTDENLKLLPDSNGEIVLPLGTLKVDTVGDSQTLDLTNRQGKLYYSAKQTYNLTSQSVTQVYVDLVSLLNYEDLPQAARDYIRIRAGRKFVQRTKGAVDTIGYEASDETRARAVVEAEEEANADRSIFDNPDYYRLMRFGRPSQWP